MPKGKERVSCGDYETCEENDFGHVHHHHAEDWGQVRQAIQAGEVVWDWEGDLVLAVLEHAEGNDSATVAWSGTRGRVSLYIARDPRQILISNSAVTPAEWAEIEKSIASALKEGGK